jgi:hypothetical protein
MADGNPKTVSITPKANKSQGTITIYYEGTDGTVYIKNTNAPSAVGKYAVTFDVAVAESFKAVTGLVAGTFTITDNFFVDFEDSAWSSGNYTVRTVSWGGYSWTVSGVVNPDSNDHYKDTKSIRLRDAAHRVELNGYINGIKSISFDYASYSNHSGGTLVVYYQKEGESTWTEAGRVDSIPSWSDAGSEFMNASFDINITGNVRFKIEKDNTASGTSVNVDNIVLK